MLAVEVSSVKQGRVRGAFPLTSLSLVFILTRVYKKISKSRKLEQIAHAGPSGGHPRRRPEDRRPRAVRASVPGPDLEARRRLAFPRKGRGCGVRPRLARGHEIGRAHV